MVSMKRILCACALVALLAPGLAAAQTVQVSDAGAVGSNPYGGATGWYQLGSNGVIWASAPWNSATTLGNWISPQSGMSNYEGRAVDNNGCSGPSTWVNLGSNSPTWSVSTGGWYEGEQAYCWFTVQIRRVSDGAILTSARIDLTAYTGFW